MLNTIILMGRLTNEPELKTTPSGTPVLTSRIAVDRSYQKGEDKQTDFIDIVAWKQKAEFISKYFSKGSVIAVVGSLQTRNFEDKNGNKRTAYEVLVSDVSFAGDKKQKESVTEVVYDLPDDDELPF